jgi:hypothetical protein
MPRTRVAASADEGPSADGSATADEGLPEAGADVATREGDGALDTTADPGARDTVSPGGSGRSGSAGGTPVAPPFLPLLSVPLLAGPARRRGFRLARVPKD